MNPTVVGTVVFTCTFAGALLGMWLRTTLPAHHLDAESRDTVKVGIGLIATMTALVLGLVTASAKSSFDAVDTAVKQSATQLLALDRALARYGSETGEKLTLLALVIAPLTMLVVRIAGARLRASSREVQRAMGYITQVIEEAIAGHRVDSQGLAAHGCGQNRIDLAAELIQARPCGSGGFGRSVGR